MTDKPAFTFNRVYDKPDFYYGLEVRPEFDRFFADRPLTGAQGLDLGCGEGRYALYLARRGCRVTGIDRSATGLEKLKKAARTENLPIVTHCQSVGDFSYAADTCDVVVAATILDHLDDPNRKRVVAGIRTALKPGGILYANVFTVADPGCGADSRQTPDNQNEEISDTAGGMAYYFSPNELKALFADWKILHYYEGVEPDRSHGRPHSHGWACLLAAKPATA